MKFLIIRLSSIGDIVLTTPVIRCLKKQVPDAEIHFLTKETFKCIVEPNPYIDKVITLGISRDIMLHELVSENYDCIIDLHNNLRTWQVKKHLGKKSFSFSKLNVQKWIFTNLKWDVMPGVHIVDRYLKTVSSFNVKNDGDGLDYFLAEGDQLSRNDIPDSHLAGYIGIVIGAAHNTKKMPAEKLRELCEKINYPVILLGGKEDKEAGDFLASVDDIKVYNACGKCNINESADLVRCSRLIISHDTGLMHIAAAFKKPLISIWGNTVPSFGMYPYYGDNFLKKCSKKPFEIVEVNNLSCRPCSKIGYKTCPKGHFKCMKQISVDEILYKVKEFLLLNQSIVIP